MGGSAPSCSDPKGAIGINHLAWDKGSGAGSGNRQINEYGYRFRGVVGIDWACH